MKIEINKLRQHPFNKIFGDLPEGEFNSLKEDIKNRGMQTRIDITKDNMIVCGHQRIRVLTDLGIKEVEVRILDWSDDRIKEHLIKDNVLRRQLNEFQIVEASHELRRIYEGRVGRPNKLGTNDPNLQEGRTRDFVAKDFGISGKTLERYEETYDKLKEAGKENIIEEVKQNKITLRDVKKKELARENEESIVNEVLDDRKIVPYGENIYYLSEKNLKDIRQDAYYVIKKGESYPTLKRRSWFFHEDGSEFSLREYANVQDFPKDFKFIGTKEKIKDQIGNAVSPKMAEHIAKTLPKGNVIELFAGCGGLGLGFEKRGCKVLWMNEFNKMASRTYRENFSKVSININNIKNIKISDAKKEIEKKVDIIIGGPPCQGFSLAGTKFKEDYRNELYKEFIRFVKGFKPKYFVMENVKGILPFKEQIVEDFEEVGYEVEVKLIKGEDIGMKQKRHRVFFIGELK